jgi:hypothetical protein
MICGTPVPGMLPVGVSRAAPAAADVPPPVPAAPELSVPTVLPVRFAAGPVEVPGETPLAPLVSGPLNALVPGGRELLGLRPDG